MPKHTAANTRQNGRETFDTSHPAAAKVVRDASSSVGGIGEASFGTMRHAGLDRSTALTRGSFAAPTSISV